MYYKLLTALLGMLMCAGIAHAAPFAYITNLSDNTVSVVDTQTDRLMVKVTLGTGQEPYGVAISADGKLVYVSNRGSKTISVIDALTNPENPTVINTLNLLSAPSGLAINPAGTRLYVANKDAESVSVINIENLTPNTTVTPTVLKTIGVGKSPTGVAMNADGNYVYVTNAGSNSVSIIRTSDNTEVKRVTVGSVGSVPMGVAVGKVNGVEKVFITSFDEVGTVSVIDALTQTVATPAIAVGSYPNSVAVAPDDVGKVYVANAGQQTVSVINILPPAAYPYPVITQAYSLQGAIPQSIAVSPDGFTVYTVNTTGGFENGGSLSSISRTTDVVTPLFDESYPFFSSPQSLGKFIGPILHEIKATAGTNGTMSPVGSKLFSTGANQVYAIIPALDYRINNISINGTIINLDTDPNFSNANSTYTFSQINRSNTIDVTFIKDYDYVSITRSNIGTGSGKVTSTPAAINCSASTSVSLCSAPFVEGTTVTITAEPDPGKSFQGWVGDIWGSRADASKIQGIHWDFINNGQLCDGVTTTDPQTNLPTCTFTMSTYTHVTAVFAESTTDKVRRRKAGGIVEGYHSTIQAAFSAATSITTEINATVFAFNEILNLNNASANFTLSGGWPIDNNYGPRGTAPTVITGSLTITNGTLTVDNIAIK